jgi:hypothetical protein
LVLRLIKSTVSARLIIDESQLGAVFHTCNPSYSRWTSGRSKCKTIPGKKLSNIPSQPISHAQWLPSVIPVVKEAQEAVHGLPCAKT